MKNQYRYTTIATRIPFPPALLSAAARAASTDALDAYWRAEKDLATGARPATVVHADVILADRVAKSLARAISA